MSFHNHDSEEFGKKYPARKEVSTQEHIQRIIAIELYEMALRHNREEFILKATKLYSVKRN